MKKTLENFVAKGHAAQVAADKAIKQSRSPDRGRRSEKGSNAQNISRSETSITAGAATRNLKQAAPAGNLVKVKVSYASCEVVTNVPLRCPLCGAQIRPSAKGEAVEHKCERRDG